MRKISILKPGLQKVREMMSTPGTDERGLFILAFAELLKNERIAVNDFLPESSHRTSFLYRNESFLYAFNEALPIPVKDIMHTLKSITLPLKKDYHGSDFLSYQGLTSVYGKHNIDLYNRYPQRFGEITIRILEVTDGIICKN